MSCISSLGNTGESNCRALLAKAKGLILVSSTNQAGNIPSIDPAIPLTDLIIDANINDSSKLDRWYPLMDLKAVTTERAENEFFTYPDGTREFNRDGIRTATFTRPSGTSAILQKLEAWEDVDMSVFIVDENGRVIGEKNTAGFVEPIKVEANTYAAIIVWGSDTQKSSSIQISFDFSSLVIDGNLVVLDPASGVNLLRKQGLLEIGVTTGATSTTTLGLTIDNGSGFINDLDKVEGLVLVDFTAFNTSTSLAVTITLVTEPTPGNYVLTFAAQTLTDIMQITVSKTGLEDSVTLHTL